MRINNNIPVERTDKNSNTNDVKSAKAREKLASGLKASRNIDSDSGAIASEDMRARVLARVFGLTNADAQDDEGSIRDVDTARQATKSTRVNILQQAQISIMAQANVLPQTVMNLLEA